MSNHAPNAYGHDASQAYGSAYVLLAHVYVGDYVLLPIFDHGCGYGVRHHEYARAHALVPHDHACVHAVPRYAERHPLSSAPRRLTATARQ